MNFTLLTTALAAVASGLAGAALAWRLQDGNITTLKLEQANERIAVARANRITLERVTLDLAKAQDKYAKSVEQSRLDRRVVDTTLDSLHDTIAATVREAATSQAACNRQVASLAVVFDQCTTAVVDMAGHAQDWFVEAIKQHESPR